MKKVINTFLAFSLAFILSPTTLYAEEPQGVVETTNTSDTNNDDTTETSDQDESKTDLDKTSEETDDSKTNQTTDDVSQIEEQQKTEEIVQDDGSNDLDTSDDKNDNYQPSESQDSSENTEQPEQSEPPVNAANAIQSNNSYQKEVNSEEIETKLNQYFPEISESDVLNMASDGMSLIVLSGNTDDENFIDMVNGYVDIYENTDDQELKQSIFFLDKDSINDKDTNKLITLSNERDREKLRNGINELKNSSTGNGVAFYIFNQRVIKVSSISDGNYDYTWFDIAHYDIQAYSHSVGKTGMETESDKSAASVFTQSKSILQSNTPSTGYEDEITTPPAQEGKEWKYAGREAIQEFIAPVNGIYHIRIWGADGDSDTAYPRTYSASVGGQGGYTYGDIHLTAGQKIYLAMGVRNYFRNGPSYNGGGAGYGQSRGFLAGGGGAASVYLTSRGNGELTNYSNYRDEIIMVAGGGGGAEDWFTGWPRYCAGLPGCIGSIYPGNGSLGDRHRSGTTAYGGNGGGLSGTAGDTMRNQGNFAAHNGVPGANTVDGQKISGYLFGVGENYAAGNNASAGAGGGGYYGGLSNRLNGDDASNLYGGAGGGGSGYYNTKLLVAGSYGSRAGKSGEVDDGGGKLDGVHFGGLDSATYPGADDGQEARGIITLKQIDSYKLTINYLDLNETNCTGNDCIVDNGVSYKKVSTTEAPTHVETLKFGDSYDVPNPTVVGYTPNYYTYLGKDYTKYEELVPSMKGKMPEHDVTINVFYDYPAVVVYYKDFDTKKIVKTTYGENPKVRLKSGTSYSVDVPASLTCDNVNYELFNYNYYRTDYPANEKALTANGKNYKITNKKDTKDEIYTVYYVPIEYPTKSIVAVNGHPISQKISDSFVELKKGDIVTYRIDYINRMNVQRTMTFSDTLPNTLKYKTSKSGPAPTQNGQKLTWTITIGPRAGEVNKYTTGSVSFDAEVIDDSTSTITNCVNYLNEQRCRTDPVVKLEVKKTATPTYSDDLNSCANAYVAHTDVISYSIVVKNTGENPITFTLVKDEIPAGTEWFYQTNNNNSRHIGKYMYWTVSDLAPGAQTTLGFKVKVTKEINDDSTFKIINYASYDTVMSYTDDTYNNLKYSSNKIMHCEVGPKITAHKDSNPVTNSIVKNGSTIDYSVSIQNTGTVKTDFVRIYDEIPAGTSYVPGSLSLVADNVQANSDYATSHNEKGDLQYDYSEHKYRILNPYTGANTGGKGVYRITVTWPNTLQLSNHNGGTVSGNTIKYASVQSLANPEAAKPFTEQQKKDFLASLRWTGTYSPNTTGSITVTYDHLNIDDIGISNAANATSQWQKVGSNASDANAWSAGGTEIWNVNNTNDLTGFFNPNADYQLFNFQTAFRTTDTSDNDYIGILFKTKKTNNSTTYNTVTLNTYLYAMIGNADDKGGPWGGLHYSGLYKIENGTFVANNVRSIKQFGPNEQHWEWNNYQTLKVVTSGDSGENFTIYYNGSPVMTAKDTSIASGGVGFWAYSQSHTYFKNVIGSAGYYTQTDTFSLNLPTPDNSSGCKYIPAGTVIEGHKAAKNYVECVTKDVAIKGKAVMKFSVKVDNNASSKYKEIDNEALYAKLWDNELTKELTAGMLYNKPDQITNMTRHFFGTPGIAVTKGANPAPCPSKTGCLVDINRFITYQLNIANNGNGIAEFVQLRDAIPEYTKFVKLTGGGSYSKGNSGLSDDAGNGFVEWVFKDLAPGTTQSVQFVVQVQPDAPSLGEITNKAYYQLFNVDPGIPTEITNPPKTPTNEVKHTLPCIDTLEKKCPGDEFAPVISVVKTSDPVTGTSIARESNIVYTLTIKNTGKAIARHILVRDSIPKGTTYVETLASDTTGAESSLDQLKVADGYSKDNNYIEWVIDWLKPNDYVKVNFKVHVEKETTLKKIENTALYFSSGGDKDIHEPGHNTSIPADKFKPSNKTVHPLIDPEIHVTKTADPPTETIVSHYQTITYKLKVVNTGTVLANYSFVEDEIPKYTTYVEDSATVDNGKDSAAYVEANGNKKARVQYLLKDMKPNEERELTFKVIVNADAPQGRSIFNTAFYNTTITNEGGTPGTPEFKVPDTKENPKHPTDTTVHVIEIMNNQIDAGGIGWNNNHNIYGITIIIASVSAVYIFIKKHSKHEEK